MSYSVRFLWWPTAPVLGRQQHSSSVAHGPRGFTVGDVAAIMLIIATGTSTYRHGLTEKDSLRPTKMLLRVCFLVYAVCFRFSYFLVQYTVYCEFSCNGVMNSIGI